MSTNTAQNGGGANGATLNNCVLTGNTSGTGGGAAACSLNNCTLTANKATTSGGGGSLATMRNCIAYFNSALSGSNYSGGTFNYCCTTPLPAGTGNFTNEASFMDYAGGNLRLQAGSPGVNSGYNDHGSGSTGLDGNPRISGGMMDTGAYELQNPTSVISYAWLQSYGLPTNGSADYADSDGDGMSNWKEWVAGTNPTNAGSVLKMLSASPGAANVIVTWLSVSNRAYSLARATNALAVPAASMVWSNIAGQPGTTSFTDPNPAAGRGGTAAGRTAAPQSVPRQALSAPRAGAQYSAAPSATLDPRLC